MTNQQKINYLYDREKKSEFDECVDIRKVCIMPVFWRPHSMEECSKMAQEHSEQLEEIRKKCKLKVYGKETKTKN